MITDKENNPLDSIVRMASIIPLFFDEPISIAITDKEKFIYNHGSEELHVDMKVGERFPKDSTATKVLSTGQPLIKEIPKELYGHEFKSYAVPIKDVNGECIGCILLAKSLSLRNKVKEAVENLSYQVSDLSLNLNEIVKDVQISSDNVQDISELMNKSMTQAESMKEILDFIHKMSKSTKMMGLNAAIEAARVGEAGSGFAVVAKEIEKLSKTTIGTAKSIEQIVLGLMDAMRDVDTRSKDTTNTFSEQTASLEEIAASIEVLNNNISVLKNFSVKL